MGFILPTKVDRMIADILEPDADETMLRGAVAPEFARKAEAEKGWPSETDCDRLDTAFVRLDLRGVLCLHNAGYTMSDEHDDAREALSEQPTHKYFGYAFYHGQDVERAIDGSGLMIAFDHVDGDVADKARVGVVLKEELENAGFAAAWDDTTQTRINIPEV